LDLQGWFRLTGFFSIIYPLGIIIAAMIYAQIHAPPKQVRITHARRTRVGSMSKYSAMPPQTPQSIQFTEDL